MTHTRLPVICFLMLSSLICSEALSAELSLTDLRWTTSQFNPSIGAQSSVAFTLPTRSILTVTVRDSGGRTVRNLATNSPYDAGRIELSWDGHNELGGVVADGAYIVAVDVTRRKTRTQPRAEPAPEPSSVDVRYYDRRTGIIAYELAATSLVRVTAEGHGPQGLASKLVVAEAARPAGAVIEAWNGFDESGSIYLPELPRFSIRIEARKLPGETVIVYGGRTAVSSAGSPALARIAPEVAEGTNAE